MITYYMDPRSGSCRRVSAVIKHLKIESEDVFVDLLAGGNQSPDFLQINPNAMVPALRDRETVLWEASAIMIYLCETYGPTELWPQDSRRFEVMKWLFWAGEHFRIPAPIYFEENVIAPLMGKEPDGTRLAEAQRRISRFAPVLQEHMKTRDFVCGNRPTLADLDLAVVVSQMPRSHVPYNDFPGIMQWVQRLETAVPAWKEAGDELDQKMTESLAAATDQAVDAAE